MYAEIPDFLTDAECQFIKAFVSMLVKCVSCTEWASRQGIRGGLFPSDSSYEDGTPKADVEVISRAKAHHS